MKKDIMNLAIETAKEAYLNKVDIKGISYLDNSIAITEMIKNPNEKIVSMLHGVLKDEKFTLQKLEEIGFSSKMVSAVDAINERADESYADYVCRLKKNKLALAAKIAYLTYHGDLNRIKNPSGKDFKHSKEFNEMKRDLEAGKRGRALVSPFTSDQSITKD